MSEQLQDYMSNLDGDIVLDSLIPANTSGAFCDLLSATHPTAGKLALKRPRGNCYDESVLARIEMEAGIWKMLRHPRILQFMGMYKIAEDIYLVSPFAENGSLPGFLRARPDADRKRLVIEIAEGLTYLHQCGIIHGDLKGNNTLISGEEHVLLCDFGLAKHVTSRTSTSLRGAGSIPWQSPEILRDASKRTFQSDVYAFGITIAEVLSGKEPYAHLSGIVSIITGVLFSGERPLKEPLNAPDGSSYLQLWEEASKCWDEDPQLRPSMFSVLKRLDPERVGMWVTAQQIALETSLDSSGDLGMMSNSEPVSDGLLGIAQGKDTLQTLRWASNIRSRLGVLFNSKQPISRITPELLAAIIWRDDTDVKLRPDHPLSHISKFSAGEREIGSTILRMFRWMELRQVSRSWHHAIDTSTQLSSLVWADSNRSNAEYIQQCHPDGPLECIVSGAEPTPLLSKLRPLASRISRLSILSPGDCAAQLLQGLALPKLCQMGFFSPGEAGLIERRSISLHPLTNPITALVFEGPASIAFQPAAFSLLQTIKIIDTEVHSTFVADLFAMFNANPNLAELVLRHLYCTNQQYTPPPAPVVHRGLQRVRLLQVETPILTPLLLFLDMENPVPVFIDNIEPQRLVDSTLAKNLLSSIRACYSLGNHVQLGVISNVHPVQNIVDLRWPTSPSVKPDQPQLVSAGETWDFNYISTSWLSNTDASKVLDVLFDTGIKVDRVTLNMTGVTDHGRAPDRSMGLLSPESHSWLEILARLDTVRKINVGFGVVSTALEHLSAPVPGCVTGSLQYLCPRLIHLEIPDQSKNPFTLWRENPASFRGLIARRQAAANTSDGPARLKKIGIPHEWVGQMEGNDSTFDGVEIFSTTDMESDNSPPRTNDANDAGPSELKLTITITLDKTVKDLKDAVASQSDVPADRQRLIYSGRVLKDEEALSTYKIQSGHTVHMVKGVARTQPEASSSPQRLPTMAAGQSPSDPLTILNTPMAHGALAGFNPFADMGLNPNDPNMLQNMMNSPAVQQQMDALMSRPEFLDTIIAQDPVLRNNPQLQQIFRDPVMRQSMMEMMRNPEVMRMAEQMRQSGAMPGGMGMGGPFGGLGGSPFGGLGGAGASQPQPGVSPWAASFAQPGSATSPSSATSAASTTSPPGTTPAATGTANPSSPGSTAPPPNPFGMIDPNMLQSILGSMGPPPPWVGGGTSPFGAASATPAANLPPPEERFQTQLQQMADMGFTDARKNIRALQATGGNVQMAIEYIFSDSGM